MTDKHGHYSTIPAETIITAYVYDKRSLREIGRMVGRHHSVIAARLERLGIERRSVGWKKKASDE